MDDWLNCIIEKAMFISFDFLGFLVDRTGFEFYFFKIEHPKIEYGKCLFKIQKIMDNWKFNIFFIEIKKK